MAANFIFEGPGKLRVTSFISSSKYEIGELNFYVSTKFGTQLQVFMILKNESGLYEIVELAKAGATGQNVLYKLPINQRLRVGNEQVDLSLLVLDLSNNLYHMSTSTKIHVTTDHYSLARQVYIAQEIGSAVQDYYARILAIADKLENNQERGS